MEFTYTESKELINARKLAAMVYPVLIPMGEENEN